MKYREMMNDALCTLLIIGGFLYYISPVLILSIAKYNGWIGYPLTYIVAFTPLVLLIIWAYWGEDENA